jgi:preprotein translocase subunit Sec61beta
VHLLSECIDGSEIKSLSGITLIMERRLSLVTLTVDGAIHVSKKKKKESSPMPAASAGLLRFFEEETEGVKVRPEVLVVAAVALIVVCVLAQIFFK